MKLILHTRTLLGVSQYDLSKYLSVNRSQINMVERGQRQLPSEKITQVKELNQYLEIDQPLEELTKITAYQ